MRYILLFVFSLLLAGNSFAQIECTSYHNDVMVVAASDATRIEGENLGMVQFRDRGFKMYCTYSDAMNYVTAQCKERGGNLIKVIWQKYPSAWSTCFRIKAKAYKVADTKLYEREILWSAARRLTVEDFKGVPAIGYSDRVAGLTHSGFGYLLYKQSAVHATRVSIYCKFSCHQSWIRQKYMNDTAVLRHEQAHFDIAEIYARKLYKAFVEEGVSGYNLRDAESIYRKIFAEFQKCQERYDDETAHGTNVEEQKRWLRAIYVEFTELPEYHKL